MRPLVARKRDRVVMAGTRGGKSANGDGPMLAAVSAVAAWRKTRVQKGPARRRRAPRWRRPVIRIGSALGGLGVIAATGFWLWHAGHVAAAVADLEAKLLAGMAAAGLTVQQVSLEGRNLAPRADLVAAVGLQRGDPILLVDVAELHRRIEGLGWIETATVSRRLPDTIHIRIRERVPFARWQRGGKTVLIDADGAPITGRGVDRYRHLPRVVGEGAATAAAEFLALLASEQRLFRMVRTATYIRKRRWDVGLKGGIAVRLPEQDVALAWRQLAKLDRKERILQRDLVAIDLRLPDRLVLRLSPSAARLRRDPGKET